MRLKGKKIQCCHFFFIVFIICSMGNLLLGIEVSEEEIQIRKDLWTIRELRDGLKTDWEQVYESANTLLDKYSNNSAVKGRIYLEVLTNHALSGLTRPNEAIEYAKQAEQFPLSPVDKAQLYLSWGDSIQFTTPGAKGEQLRKTRREAATKYLYSMKVSLDNKLPKTLPPKPIPTEDTFTFDHVIINIPDNASPELREKLLKDKAALEERRKKREEYYKAKDLWEYQKEVIDRCVYSRDLTVKLYATLPYDTPELEKLATEILGDPETVADLVQRTNARIKEIMSELTGPILDKLTLDISSELITPPVEVKPEPGTVPAKTISTPNEMAQPRLVEEAEENRIKDDKIEEQPSAAVQQVSDSSSSYSSWIAVSIVLAVIAFILYRVRKGIL